MPEITRPHTLYSPFKLAFGACQAFLQRFRDPDRGYGLDQVADFALDLTAPRGQSLFPLAVFRCSSGRKFMQVALNLGYGCGREKLCLDHAQQAIIDILTASRHACANACATVLVRYASVGPVSTVSMVLVVTLLPGVHWRELSELSGSGALLAAVLFVVLSATAGWVIGGPQAGPRRILALCCGQPNMAAAFVIANQNFSDPRVILMLLVVLIASLLILLPLTFFFARRPLAPHA